MKIIKIINDIFKLEILVVANCTTKEANKYLKKIDNKWFIECDTRDTVGQLVRAFHGQYRIIYLEKLNKSQQSRAELVHELFHLVIRICDDKGVPNVPNIHTGHCGDETGAYLIEYYYNEIMKRLN